MNCIIWCHYHISYKHWKPMSTRMRLETKFEEIIMSKQRKGLIKFQRTHLDPKGNIYKGHSVHNNWMAWSIIMCYGLIMMNGRLHIVSFSSSFFLNYFFSLKHIANDIYQTIFIWYFIYLFAKTMMSWSQCQDLITSSRLSSIN